MEPPRYTLTFKGPFALGGDHAPIVFADAIANESGLYVWTVPYAGGGLIVTYVGETQSSFGQRMKEHTIQTLGGNYRVSDPDQLCQGVDEIVWNGLWRRGTRDKLPEYLDRFTDLAPVIKRQLLAVRVLVAPFQGERRVRRRIEAALAAHIWNQPPPASSLLPRDIRYHAQRGDEEPIPVRVLRDVEVLGFPVMFEA